MSAVTLETWNKQIHEKVRPVGYYQEFVTRCTVNEIKKNIVLSL